MQPYFFPYFEQFRLISACDLWVVFDTPQFSRKSWITRNRILNRDKGWTYVSLPVKHTGLSTPIQDALVQIDPDWRQPLLNKIKVYQGEAPHYARVRELIDEALAAEHETVADLNTGILQAVCAYLKISTPFLVASDLLFAPPPDCAAGEWALHICKHLGASEYRNAAGGTALFDEALYARHGILLSFHQHHPRNYATGTFKKVDDLSIIDWMMWNDAETLREWLA